MNAIEITRESLRALTNENIAGMNKNDLAAHLTAVSAQMPQCPACGHSQKLHRGVTCINDAEGTYAHEKKAVLLAIITREEYSDFKHFMAKDPSAFVSL